MGKQGVISSLCPIHTVDQQGGHDPVYGYRPAITAIVDRLKHVLADQCLPGPLSVDTTGHVPCLVLATLEAGKANQPEDVACNRPDQGLSVPPANVLLPFQKTQHDAWIAANRVGEDSSTLPTCQVAQIAYEKASSCAKDSNPGWCYVTGGEDEKCAEAIQFTAGTPPNGSTVTLQCIEEALDVTAN
jgi:hypothetical protein